MNIKPLTFIDIIDDTGRTSSLAIHGRRKNKNKEMMLSVVGGLPHTTDFAPKTIADANKLIAWLNEWKDQQQYAAIYVDTEGQSV